MAVAKWSTPGSESANIAGTALNSLANGAVSALLGEIDNSTGKDLYVNFWLTTGSFTPSAGGSVTIVLRRKRGSTFADGTATIINGEQVTGAFTTTASVKNIALDARLRGPYVYGIYLINNAGGAFPASGNEFYWQVHNEDVS